MSKIKKNIIANYIGNGWTGIMSLIFVPLYIKLMGAESYGIVGMLLMLRTLFSVFDMGLSTTINRELAIMSTDAEGGKDMRDMVWTLGVIYWAVALMIGIIVFLFSDLIATQWLNPEQLSTETVSLSINLIAIVIFLQWPMALYMGGLMGIQKQVLLNIINIVFSTLTGAGAILILIFVSSSIEAYLLWQVAISVVQISVTIFALWRSLPPEDRFPEFRIDLLKKIWKFATGMSGVVVMGIIIMQADKVILSNVLSLTVFGYYSFASTVAFSLFRIVSPIYIALYPSFSQLIELKNYDKLKELYHQGSQLMAVIILPIAAVIAFFSKEILLIWTNNPPLVQNSYIVVSILVVANAINGLLNIPAALQYAYSWTKLALISNIVAAVIIIPFIYLMTIHFGVIGAALPWLILSICGILFIVQIMYSSILKSEKKEWYLNDVFIPIIVSFSIVAVAWLLFPEEINKFFTILYLFFTLCISYFFTAFFSTRIRILLLDQWRGIKQYYGN